MRGATEKQFSLSLRTCSEHERKALPTDSHFRGDDKQIGGSLIFVMNIL